MSLPREPRQLMMTLMYLVLTAMLAMNVSAEILLAFYQLEDNFERNNEIINRSSNELIKELEEIAKTKTDYKPLVKEAKAIQHITDDFIQYINDLRLQLIKEAGGVFMAAEAEHSPKLIGRPRKYKNQEIAHRMFVTGDYFNKQHKPKGIELYEKIKGTEEKYLVGIASLWQNEGVPATMFVNPKYKESALNQLKTELISPNGSSAQEWVQTYFHKMPVGVVFALLRKFENDARYNESHLINFLASQMSTHRGYDKFDVFANSPKSYIIKGEAYDAEIALGAFSDVNTFKVSVDGKELPVQEGRAVYKHRPQRIGAHSFTAQIEVINPLTDEVELLEKTFYYEVGLPSNTVAADKMNVLYVGVDNPVTIVKPKPFTQVYIKGEGNIEYLGGNHYRVYAQKIGTLKVVVGNPSTGKKIETLFYKKRIPQPRVQLGSYKGDGLIDANRLKIQKRLHALLDNFDFDAQCHIQSFTLYHIPKREDAVEYQNQSPRFNAQIQRALREAKEGDQYIFSYIRAKCPADEAPRKLNSLSFTVK